MKKDKIVLFIILALIIGLAGGYIISNSLNSPKIAEKLETENILLMIGKMLLTL